MVSMTCPICGTPAPEGGIFCDECGYDLRSLPVTEIPTSQRDLSSVTCPGCGHANRPQAIFCERCGEQLAAELLPAYQPPIGTPLSSQVAQIESTPVSEDQEVVSPGKLRHHPRLIIPGTQNVIWLPSTQAEVILGREDAISGVFPDISLEAYGGQEAGVSRRHVRLIAKVNGWFIEDLESVNGTYLNGKPLNPRQLYPLKPGDIIRLGKLNLEFQMD